MTPMNSNFSPSDLLVTYKPSGIKMHRSSPEDWGWVEWLEEKLHLKLFLFQRLDLGTSGLVLIARTEQSAQEWTQKFQQKTVKKTYLFLTKARSKETSTKTIESHICKEKGLWINKQGLPPNSETTFEFIQRHGEYELWKAFPKTGKAHQIRLHAQRLGMPLLGDPDHGGAPFFRLCLHALRLEDLESSHHWEAVPAPFFENLPLLEEPDLCALLDASHQREQLKAMGVLNSESFRLAHQECPTLRIDHYGSQLWVYDYQNNRAAETVQRFLSLRGPTPTYIREMKNRGGQPNDASLVALNHPASRWVAQEK